MRRFPLKDCDIHKHQILHLAPFVSVFLQLMQGEDLTELLRQDKIIIHGDVKTAQLLVDLLQQVEFDFEEELSKFTGDIVAHQEMV
jgi:ubiquinone biosynthesis protein UbiJ